MLHMLHVWIIVECGVYSLQIFMIQRLTYKINICLHLSVKNVISAVSYYSGITRGWYTMYTFRIKQSAHLAFGNTHICYLYSMLLHMTVQYLRIFVDLGNI